VSHNNDHHNIGIGSVGIKPSSIRESKRQYKQNYLESCQNNFSIIIDCSFEDNHNDADLKSLGQQIAYSYGYNRRHSNPCELYLTGMGPKLTKQLSKSSFENWLGVHHTSDCYSTFDKFIKTDYKQSGELNSSSTDTISNTNTNTIIGDATEKSTDDDNNNNNNRLATTMKKQLVYLTSDGDEVLEALDINTAYIIGGIVDRNKYKRITYLKAKEEGIRTAKLPIKEYFKLASTHILTVNHVFEILLQWSVYKEWQITLESVIPTRKELKPLNSSSNNNLLLDEHKHDNDNKSTSTNNLDDLDSRDDEDHLPCQPAADTREAIAEAETGVI
jgi:tRNA (guanine9-N1)-methyltransferase